MLRLDALRHLVEDLALRLVVEEPVTVWEGPAMSYWRPALEAIRSSAVREQAHEVAQAAHTFIESIRTTDGPDHAPTQLQEGIACLQRALEREGNRHAVGEISLSQDPELLCDFILESREHLVGVEAQVLKLEKNPGDQDALNSVFRSFHTIKGLAGFLEMWEVQKVAHEVETVLDLARQEKLTIALAAIDVVLETADYLRMWLTHLESGMGNAPSAAPARDESLLSRIRSLSFEVDEPAQPAGELGAMALAVESAVPAETAQSPAAPPNEAMAIKVGTGKLDYLVDMAGEMVIAESMVRHDPELAAIKNPRLQRNIAQLTRITTELQKTAMAMRLVPVGPLFRRMARLVRDLSRQFGKQVEMETRGDEIELDRTIVEELSDPLMHMVRNAVDHGIESPEERQRSGKNPVARLLLKAQHQSGHVLIEITDDGRGLDSAKIIAKAAERGHATENLSDMEAFNLIFAPGFSTAAEVTNISGRGVGMDVVRKHIEKLRGRIEIRSTLGLGTTFQLKLPLTLAIIDGLVVGVGVERYIVPLFAVRELFRPGPDTMWTVQQQAEMALVRGCLLPVLRLYRKFGIAPRSEDLLQSALVVAEVEGQAFCILVDELIGKQEVVIKSLGETFQHVPGIAGGAILGDGRVGLILDLDGLFKDGVRDANR